MKSFSQNSRENNGWHILFILAVSFLIISPVIFNGVPFGTADFGHHLQISEAFYDSLKHGQIIPDWIFEENNGYGAVTVRFYPPLLHFSLAIFRFITGDWRLAIYFGFVFWSFVGGLGIYVWTRDFFDNRWQATVAAVLFILAPYHLNQFYNSFMWGEFAALSVLPFGFYYAEKVCSRRRISDIAGFGVSLSLLVLSNLPQTVIGAIVIGIYICLHLEKSRIYSQIFKLSSSFLIALMCSSFYLVRVIYEMSWINISQPNSDPDYDFHNHFLLDNFSFDGRGVWFASLIFAILIFLIVLALTVSGKMKIAAQDKNIRNILILIFLSVLMMLPTSRLIWENISFLQKIQFPWRFLSILTIGASIVLAFCSSFVNGENLRSKRPLIILLVGAILIYLTFSVKQVALGALFLEPQEFAAFAEKSVSAKGLPHWLPVWANEKTFDSPLKVSAGERVVAINQWDYQAHSFSVAAGKPLSARIGILYYPHWRAKVNGVDAETYAANDGALTLDLPAEESQVELYFAEPEDSLISRKISIFGLIIVLLLCFYQKFYTRQSK